MPKKAEYRIEWSEISSGYEVIHGPLHFDLMGDSGLHFWMERLSTFHFCSPTGYTLTVRKEQKKRGAGYWYVYKRVNGRVCKKYFGDIRKLDLQTLERLARSFVEPESEQPPPPRQPTLKFAGTLESALFISGFLTIPNKKALIARYRELSMQHHPDRGGLHQDMVAVNLAYNYLKSFVS